MSTPEARAARKKAILSRGSDRLAKLTTSARGEDAPAYLHDGQSNIILHQSPGQVKDVSCSIDPPLAGLPPTTTRNFLGEESSDMPTPPSLSPSPSPQPARKGTTPSRNANANVNANIFEGLGGGATDPSVWLPEQQQQFMQALMNASTGGPSPFGDAPGIRGSDAPPMDNPFAALMGPLARNGGEGAAGGAEGLFPPFGPDMAGMFPGAVEQPKEKTKIQKAMPLLHLIAVWCLLAYFVLWAEPQAYKDAVGEDVGLSALSLWRRWSNLGQKNALLGDAMQAFKVQIVPFFWAFTTLQIALHSLRIFSGFDTVQPPTLLALALPHLPSPLPSLIINSLKYMQMGSLFLDDLSGLVVGVGFIIYFSGWFAQSQS
ncbi:hypothetical protein CVT25_010681 [Psilocybe cyanescens]|uniref:Golgi to ER traffic protein 2 n=1 Tax=Psilocybe cyanescens TaxID=93625 RepID=A0A409WJZ1_PSICY|nr:hypothetical protein CVT25_010681 [Psilocybe cyanescens]